MAMGESNTVVSAYTMYRHLQQYCCHPSTGLYASNLPGVMQHKVATDLYKYVFNSLLNNKILDRSKLKGFADHKLILAQMMRFIFNRRENIVGKGENAGIQHFLLFPQCFHKVSSFELVKTWHFFGKRIKRQLEDRELSLQWILS